MLLVCGPTGSGKTTTLYSLLKFIDKPESNIITVEDPIEYQIEGINQVNIKPEIGLTFASSLRSILRQDPDIIMIGEIRDFDAADIAANSAPGSEYNSCWRNTR
jgi:type II secretory ATPase GspE/PulE/Tfp pilus assembly ATPase PilB-like protein